MLCRVAQWYPTWNNTSGRTLGETPGGEGMARLHDRLRAIERRLTENGYRLSPYRWAEDVEAYRDNEYHRWSVNAHAWMGAHTSSGTSRVYPAVQRAAPIPSDGSREIALQAAQQWAELRENARLYQERVRGSSEYLGKYVAVYGGEVIAADPDVSQLCATILAGEDGAEKLRRSYIEFVGPEDEIII